MKNDLLGHQPRIYANLGLLISKPIAYTIYFLTYSSYLALPILYIEDIFVLNKWRKKGFGYQVFQFCVQQAKKIGCTRIEWSAYNWNKTAIKFYRAINANHVEKKYFRLDKKQFNKFIK